MSILFNIQCGNRILTLEAFDDLHVQVADPEVESELAAEVEFGETSICLIELGIYQGNGKLLLMALDHRATLEEAFEWVTLLVYRMIDQWEELLGGDDILDIMRAAVETTSGSFNDDGDLDRFDELEAMLESEQVDALALARRKRTKDVRFKAKVIEIVLQYMNAVTENLDKDEWDRRMAIERLREPLSTVYGIGVQKPSRSSRHLADFMSDIWRDENNAQASLLIQVLEKSR